jgi:uncharacterized repeat protein (TIGR03803 family)
MTGFNRRGLAFVFAVGACVAAVLAPNAVQAQTFKIIHAFSGLDGARPADGVTLDKSGNLLGTTSAGGRYDAGTIFKITPAGEETILHNFGRLPANGVGPNVSPVLDREGNIWGVTQNGGFTDPGCNCGVAYLLGDTGKFTILHRFSFPQAVPTSRLVRDKNQNLFGTVFGFAGPGFVYKMDREGHFTVLHKFPNNGVTGAGPDGAWVDGPVALDQAGNVYGTAQIGGSAQCGVAFKLTPDGKETILHDFTGGIDGCRPSGGLTFDSAGNLYGVAQSGGDPGCGLFGEGGCGVIFKIAKDANFSVLYTFENGIDNLYPSSRPAFDKSGNLYGTTGGGPADDPGGTVFRFGADGVFTTLHRFDGGFEGTNPSLPPEISVDAEGNVFGTTASGGDPNCSCGIVFEITPK